MIEKYGPINPKFPHMLHGGDYNPDQWPEEVWSEDMRLMKLAHCNAMSVGIFSWTHLEPEEGRFEFGWLDRVMDMLADNGAYAVLATPTGARPAWMSAKYPEVLRVRPDGGRNLHGRRHNHCFTSPVYREKTHIINTRLAERYKDHPALLLWHLSNEYGGECHCDLCRAAFPDWLQPTLRFAGRPQPGLVDRVLEPHLHRLGPDRAAQRDRRDRRPRPQPGLEAFRHRPDHRLHAQRDGPAARDHARRAHHDQLHGHVPRSQLLADGPAPGRDLVGLLSPVAWRTERLGSGIAYRLPPRHQPLPQGRQTVHAHGIDAEHDQLDAGGQAQAARHAPALVVAGRGPRLGHRPVFPVAQEPRRVREVPRRGRRPCRARKHPRLPRRGRCRRGAGETGPGGGHDYPP